MAARTGLRKIHRQTAEFKLKGVRLTLMLRIQLVLPSLVRAPRE